MSKAACFKPLLRFHHQRGVALISILLMLTLLATLAIYAAEDQDMAIRRAENLGLAEQGYQVNQSGEQWVIKVLEKDQQDDLIKIRQQQPVFDHASDVWGNLGPPVEVGETGTSLLMVVEDLQGRLNLNNLVQGKAPQQTPPDPNAPANPGQQPDAMWFQIFRNLLVSLDLNPELVDSMIDWVDPDETPIGTTGAEDFYYTGLELPYRSANRGMASSAELVAIKDMTPKVIEQILPLVTALPVDGVNSLTKVNVNTASARVLSLFAASQPADLSALKPLLAQRDTEPFTTLAEYASEFDSAGIGSLVKGYQSMLSVTSDFYAGRSCAEAGRVKFSMSSLLRKITEKENVKVLQRERYFGCPAFPKTDKEQPDEASENA